MIPKTAAELTPEDMARYREGARKQQRLMDQQIRQRLEKARITARQAAAFLRERFQVERVVLFGSVAVPDLFHARSDIDLAVWGLDEREYFRVVGLLQAINPEFSIDLILFTEAPDMLQEAILKEGVNL